MIVGASFIIHHSTGAFEVSSGNKSASDSDAHDTESALFFLRHAFANQHAAVVQPIEHWHAARLGVGVRSPVSSPLGRLGKAFGSPTSTAGHERTRMQAWEAFENAVRSGALVLRRVQQQPVLVLRPEALGAPLAASRSDEEPTFFEATLVDEIGQPIAGLELVLSCEGQNYDLTTNAAGFVRKDGVTASRASLRVKSTERLREILAPRWCTQRQGELPRDKNLLRAELSDELESFPIAANTEHLIVIAPALAPLHVEWWDGRGKHRLTKCQYQVTGPRSFRGTTNANGQLLHPDVPLGQYTVTLTVEYFTGRGYATTRTFDETVVVTKNSGLQVRRVGPTPEVAFQRTRGYLFDTRKSFLMPRAAKRLLATVTWWKDRAPSHLLIAGHTDVTGEQTVNDALSQERADAVKAFLEQDVAAWLAFYDKQDAWGSREDRLMIRSLPDFATRNTAENQDAGSAERQKPETIVEWFQRTRGLEVDDVAGPATRHALISEYMGKHVVTLRETPGYPVSITTLGEGEDYPLAETGLPLDMSAVASGPARPNNGSEATDANASGKDGAANSLDRRVELFFFDVDFGIVPPIGAVGGPEYIEWRKRAEEERDVAVEKEVQTAKYFAVRSAQFRTGSAVMLPEGDAPNTDGTAPLTSVGILASALRYNEEYPGHCVLVAGHTDSVGSDSDNDELSSRRAELIHAVLTGGEEGRRVFQDIADETGAVSDWKQILKWAAWAFPCVEELVDEEAQADAPPPTNSAASNEHSTSSETRGASSTVPSDAGNSNDEPIGGALGTGFTACDPGEVDDDETTGATAVKAFQTAYNENYKLLGGSGTIAVDGDVGTQTWGAIYDLYQYNLAQELGETFEGLAELRARVHLLPTSKPYVGFGESAPVEAYQDDSDAQSNRRVEVLFFESGQEPDVALLDESPHVSELYHGDVFTRIEIPGRPGGAKAHWTIVVAYPDGEERNVILENEAGTYRQQQSGSRMTFRGAPGGSVLRIFDCDSPIPVADRMVVRSMVPISKLQEAVRAIARVEPLALDFVDYPLEEMAHGR